MKRLRDGRIVHAPLNPAKPLRDQDRQRTSTFLSTLLTVAIVAGLIFSVVPTLKEGMSTHGHALGQTTLPVDFNRIDASGEDETTQQEGIIFDVMPDDIKMEILGFADDAPKNFQVTTEGPQILIYHTHTREAYNEKDVAVYNSGKWHTTQQSYSVVAVGEVLKTELENCGFSVIHDTTDHVPPSQASSYSRSLQTMNKYANKYPTLRVFIDVHRDAYNDIESGSKDFVTVNGEECARMMFVVDNGEGYDVKPDYESNYKLAQAITNELEKIRKGFTRPIRIKSHSHNQNVSDMCLLIELGHNANTLEQAKNAAKYAALAISRVVGIG
jgi:stage II sporulation protein P